jgi:glucose-6-phosphate 1-dehydrogenase
VRCTEIAISFKQRLYAAFQPVEALKPNWLVLRITPDEGILLQFEVKRRGRSIDIARSRPSPPSPSSRIGAKMPTRCVLNQ